MPLLVLSLSGSAALAGLVSAAWMAPNLLALLGGVLVDRVDRRRLMLGCDAVRCLAMASIAVAAAAGRLTIPHVVAVMLIEGTLSVLFRLASTAALADIVAAHAITDALGAGGLTDASATLVGGPAGGVLFGLGAALPFAVDALSYGFSVVSLWFVRIRPRALVLPAPPTVSLGDGLRFFRGDPVIRASATLLALFNPVFCGSTLLLILLARARGSSPFAIGVLFAIQGIGAALASTVASRIVRRLRYVVVVAGALCCEALALALLALAPDPVALGLLAAAFAGADVVSGVAITGHRLAVTPAHLQGRVGSVFHLTESAGLPVGVAAVGGLAQLLGATTTAVILAGWVGTLAIGAGLYQPFQATNLTKLDWGSSLDGEV